MSSQAAPRSPGSVLYRERDSRPVLPVCDHYCGSPALLAKSLAIQGRLGPVLDITADCEDGAPAGDELGHALRMAQAIDSPDNRFNRVGARTHPVFHACFKAELDTLMTHAGHRLAYLTLPKVRSVAEICTASTLCQQHEARLGLTTPVPFQVLIESPAALAEVHAIAAHPRVQALCFGLMDYVSSFEGAIGADALHGARQFEHPLLVRALTDISLAAHAHGKVAVHSVTLAIGDGTAAGEDARRAAQDFGYQRKWSIHPRQVEPIIAAFQPPAQDVRRAGEILLAAQAADWGPSVTPTSCTTAPATATGGTCFNRRGAPVCRFPRTCRPRSSATRECAPGHHSTRPPSLHHPAPRNVMIRAVARRFSEASGDQKVFNIAQRL